MLSKTVAKIGIYSLKHQKYTGGLGEPREIFEVWWVDQTGPNRGTTNYILVEPPLRVLSSRLLFPPLHPYTKKDYMAILKDSLIKFNLK